MSEKISFDDFLKVDLRVGRVIERVWREGGKFDGWSEHFSYERWTTVANEELARFGVDLGKVQIAAYVDNLFDSVFIVAQDPTIRRYSRPRVSGLQLRYSW